ncbi:Dehydrogenase multihelical [Penicillium canariense]|uniref:Dehydrogenase multihelical n=1 Tax=Penicillium canariense TaxID=189055 RepID=A0A9W9HWN6_9EURO|nr:Dehydrogenase multihelical [Penicillium canariense]KAJ5160364.1 Dehydrogenase multihelical [Penicillium canariense]
MDTPPRPAGSVVIIGAGTQGRRLAFMWSSRGGSVCLVDLQEQQLHDGLSYVHQLRSAEASLDRNWGEVALAHPTSLDSKLQDAWLVVECVPENLALKQKVITQLDDLAPKDTIIASNSSSYGISEIIAGLNLKQKSRILSAHCYWPPETSAIEIMGHKDTDPAAVSLLLEQCKSHGFSPFHVKKDSIGIWAAIKRETLLALSEGVCTPQEIDAIFKDVLKTPKGPCEQMDVVGLDVVLDIENHYADSRAGVPDEPREYLQKMIHSGHLGIKNGEGFYKYAG